MRNLLAANFYRLRRSRAFRLAVAGTLLLSALFVLYGGRMERLGVRAARDLDYYCFYPLPFAVFPLSAFVSLLLGAEHSDGTIRNKLIVGHSRAGVYLADLLCCFGGTAILFAAWLVGNLAGLAHFGVWTVGVGGWLLTSLLELLSFFALVSVFVLLAHLIGGKAAGTVGIVFAGLGLLIAGSYVYNALLEPESIAELLRFTEEGGLEFAPPTPNPAYIGGTLRKVYESVLHLLPTGQEIWISDESVTEPWRMAGSSLLWGGAFTALGLGLFGKKDLK